MNLWWCVNCQRTLMHLGVPRHRAMHRDRRERVVMETWSHRYTYDYRDGAED